MAAMSSSGSRALFSSNFKSCSIYFTLLLSQIGLSVSISIAHPGAECTCFCQVGSGRRGSLTFFPKGVFKIRQICYTKKDGERRAAPGPRPFHKTVIRLLPERGKDL